ncbi:MAG TPA: cytochrome c biogenesis protein ResB [Nocardioides sp.]|uniref:cytochrome c biogenesis protein ResB n=1 Tax=Nocardioides sp. TaxID=35761 RepID=UPI002E32B2A3|nr:cytochrome c biogenesis protein ResB [Nocardioides sp.]HEX3933017.1 cytochrome c biogenesis protein ResB [Nocardioides sp.]
MTPPSSDVPTGAPSDVPGDIPADAPADADDLSGPGQESATWQPSGDRDHHRRAGELSAVELLRWTWRQLTSMRTALMLLLLLALGAIPGSVIPQTGVDALKTQNWQAAHPRLTPVYQRLSLFNVYHSAWFAAIYLLLMISLVGCIVPRLLVYWRGYRKQPPAAPRNLTRLPDHASYTTDEEPDVVLERAARVLSRRNRVSTSSTTAGQADDGWVSAERGQLREAGNLLFHLAVLLVLVGFGIGSLFGYKGGVILVVGNGFSNQLTQYDDFDPGSLFNADKMEPFCFTVHDFAVHWIDSGPKQGLATGFKAPLTYREKCGSTPATSSSPKQYDLRVNHPLKIGGTQIFLIGHGYAPLVTVRDAQGHKLTDGPAVFLPESPNFLSFGVVKASGLKAGQDIGLEGLFYPTFASVQGQPINIMGNDRNPALSLKVYVGDLGLNDGVPQSVYTLDKSAMHELKGADGKAFQLELSPGQTVQLPDHEGSVTFNGVRRWTRLQISRTPDIWLTLLGVVLALVGLLGSLFIRPRRLWVRARRGDGATLVEVAALDRSGGGDLAPVLSSVVESLRQGQEGTRA